MALGFDGSIRIDTMINSSGFIRGIGEMNQGFNRLTVSLRALAGLVAKTFGTLAVIKFGKDSIKAASDLSNAWMGLGSIVEGQGKSFSKAKSFINDYISDGLVPLENAVTSYKNLAARGYSTDQIEKVMTALKDAAAFGRQSSYTLGEAVATATEGLKNENSILVDNAGVTKNVAKMWDEYAKSIGTTAKNLTQEQKIQAEVNGILEETKFQTGDAAKLAGTYSGQVAMLTFNFQQLKVAVGEALIPIAQAVLPSINAIIAALTKLARMFAKVTAMLFGKSTKVVATGQKEIADTGLAAANSTDKLADSLGDAGSAAKKAAKDMETATAPFDEFNILAFSAAKNASDAAGAGEADFGIPDIDDNIEDYEAIEEEFDSLADLFAKMLEDMLAAMPNFKQALLDFADAFNSMNQKLYEAFKDPRILPMVKELGRELADAFNDLVGAIKWELWGRTVGAGLNLALEFLKELIYGFDWIGLGKSLAEFINGLVDEIEWEDFGRLLWAGFKIALETLAGLIIGANMPLLAKAASDIVKGFFDEMTNTIQRIEWDTIGKQIALFLNNVDWYGSITSVFSAIAAALNALKDLVRNFVDTMQWSDIAIQIYTAINESLGKVEWKELGKALGDLFINAFNFLRDVIRGIDWFQIGEDIAEFMNGIDWTELTLVIANALDEAMRAGLKLLAGFISKADPDTIVAAFNIFFGAALGEKLLKHIKLDITKLAKSMMSILWTEIKSALSPLIGKIVQAIGSLFSSRIFAGAIFVVSGLIKTFENFFDIVIDGFTWAKEIAMLFGIAMTAVGAILFGFPATVVAGIAAITAAVASALAVIFNHIEDIKNAFANFKEVLMGIGENIVDGLKKGIEIAWKGLITLIGSLIKAFLNTILSLLGIHSPSTVFAEIGGNIVAGLIQGISEKWGDVISLLSEKITALKEAVQEKFNGIREAVSNVWENVRKDAQSKWEGIKASLAETWAAITETAKTRFEETRQKVLEAWSNVMADASAKWQEITGSLVEKWSDIRDKAKAKFEEIRKKVAEAWDNVKKDVAGKWDSIKSALETAWGKVKDSAVKKFSEIKDSIFDKMSELKNKNWKSIGTEMVNGIQNGLNGIFTKLSGWAKKVWNSVSSAFNSGKASVSGGSSAASVYSRSVSSYSAAAADYGTYQIPKLANGAVIPPNQQFLAILGDQRSGTNIEAPLSAIKQAVIEGMQEIGNTGGEIVINLTNEMDGTVLTKKIIRIANNMTRSKGESVFLF